MASGYKIPRGPKDAIMKSVQKNHNPGPGHYYYHTINMTRRGDHSTMGLPDINLQKPLYDNGVPGPGQYDKGPEDKIPSFKIVDQSTPNDKLRKKQLEQASKQNVGPQTYSPTRP